MSDLATRVWAKIEKRSPEECWLWTGATGQKDGPVTTLKKKTLSTRRVIWELEHGGVPLPRNRQVATTCKAAKCLNPAHLYLRPWMDDVTRFWTHVRKGEGDACWEWHGTMFERGYGSFSMLVDGVKKDRQAHRVSYEIAHGRIEGHVPGHHELERVVMHTCDNPRCVRPDHLELGTDATNIADMIAKGRNSRGKAHAEAMRAAKQRQTG